MTHPSDRKAALKTASEALGGTQNIVPAGDLIRGAEWILTGTQGAPETAAADSPPPANLPSVGVTAHFGFGPPGRKAAVRVNSDTIGGHA